MKINPSHYDEELSAIEREVSYRAQGECPNGITSFHSIYRWVVFFCVAFAFLYPELSDSLSSTNIIEYLKQKSVGLIFLLFGAFIVSFVITLSTTNFVASLFPSYLKSRDEKNRRHEASLLDSNIKYKKLLNKKKRSMTQEG